MGMRLFVAVEIPRALRDELVERSLSARHGRPKARWVRPEGMHLTLSFLGDTDPARLPDLHRELAPAFASEPPIELRIREPGAFPPRGRVRTLWARIETAGGGDLAAVQAAVAQAVARAAGIRPEKRPFHPHVTLARCSPPWPRPALEGFAAAFGEPVAESFVIRVGTLFESELRPSGARYRVVREYPLGD
ncbi:MAG: RNA 2',3'-cyclic phosphodiesterase [bacterium]|nr:RNA 2',3'-cyclic phosphodiesterase [bacterium]